MVVIPTSDANLVSGKQGRRMRIASVSIISALVLAACSPPVPDSGAIVSATPARAGATASALPPAAPVAATSLDDSGGAIAAETSAMLGLNSAPTTGAPLSALAPDAAAAAPVGLSDEQNFAAVSERESIESDAARIEANRAQYVAIQPTELPPRPDGSGASIVAFALATTNDPGQSLYSRSGIAAASRFERACAKYGSPDRAQEAFLDAGGPERDRYGMDPDGDGFACSWDPRPFRAARDAAPEVVDTYVDAETSGES
jgi:hypothetical protein